MSQGQVAPALVVEFDALDGQVHVLVAVGRPGHGELLWHEIRAQLLFAFVSSYFGDGDIHLALVFAAEVTVNLYVVVVVAARREGHCADESREGGMFE